MRRLRKQAAHFLRSPLSEARLIAVAAHVGSGGTPIIANMSTESLNQAEAASARPGDGSAAGGHTVDERRQTLSDRRSSLDRRRGPGRRRTDYRRDAEEGHMNEEQLEFLKAVEEYKRVNSRPFPTWTELLDVVLYLGYRKVAPMGEFKMTKGRQHPLSKG